MDNNNNDNNSNNNINSVMTTTTKMTTTTTCRQLANNFTINSLQLLSTVLAQNLPVINLYLPSNLKDKNGLVEFDSPEFMVHLKTLESGKLSYILVTLVIQCLL